MNSGSLNGGGRCLLASAKFCGGAWAGAWLAAEEGGKRNGKFCAGLMLRSGEGGTKLLRSSRSWLGGCGGCGCDRLPCERFADGAC